MTTLEKTVVLISRDAAFCDAVRSTFNAARHMSVSILACDMTEAADQTELGTADVIVADIDSSRREHLTALGRLMSKIGGRIPVIVLIGDMDEAMGRWLMQVRVADFLRKPAKPDELLRASLKLLRGSATEGQREAEILTFVPAAGGVGNTTLAVETAFQKNRRGTAGGETTCLIDLDFANEACADFLDLEPRLNLDEIGQSGERLDLQLLEVLCTRHESGLYLIAAPAKPAQMCPISSEAILRLLEVAAMRFDNVIIDMPRAWFPWTDDVLAGSNRILVVTDMTVPGLRFARRLVTQISARLTGLAKPQVIVNRFNKKAMFHNGLRSSDVEKALNGSFAGGVVNNYPLVREAIDRGIPLESVTPGNDVSEDLAKIIFSDAIKVPLKSKLASFFARF